MLALITVVAKQSFLWSFCCYCSNQ